MPRGGRTSTAQWDFRNHHVQVEVDGDQFIQSGSTLIAAGPPKLRMASGLAFAGTVDPGVAAFGGDITAINPGADNVKDKFVGLSGFAYPMGLLETFTVSQAKQLQRLFEIGSKRSYFVVGRPFGTVNIGRTMFDGPSLLRVLMAYYPVNAFSIPVQQQLRSLLNIAQGAGFSAIRKAPGYGDLFIALSSDLFDHPMGILVLMLDNSGEKYGAFYLEDCYIRSHQFGISSGANIIAEGTTMEFDDVVGIDIGADREVRGFTQLEAQFTGQSASVAFSGTL